MNREKWEPWHVIILVAVILIGIAMIFHGFDWLWRTS